MADLKTTEEERARFRAYIGEHHHEDLTYKARLDELVPRFRALEAENAKLRHHYDAAAPEHNLLALLDLYEGRRLEAEAEVGRLRAEIESWRAGVKVAQGILDARAALGEP